MKPSERILARTRALEPLPARDMPFGGVTAQMSCADFQAALLEYLDDARLAPEEPLRPDTVESINRLLDEYDVAMGENHIIRFRIERVLGELASARRRINELEKERKEVDDLRDQLDSAHRILDEAGFATAVQRDILTRVKSVVRYAQEQARCNETRQKKLEEFRGALDKAHKDAFAELYGRTLEPFEIGGAR